MFRTHELRSGWVPSLLRGQRCSSWPESLTGQRPPLHNGTSLHPATASIDAGLPLTKHQRGFKYFTRPIFPSPVTPGWNRSPSLSTSGETLTIEELLTLRARTETAGDVGVEHEWSWAADEAAAGREDQRGVAGLGFGAGGRAAPEGVPDPELVEQAKRRKFTAKYKAEILAKADACTRPGEVGELLRREGLYTSHLTYWRKQREAGALKELGKQRGRKPVDRRDEEIAKLTRKLERSEAELAKMKRVVEIQGNVSALLEEMLGTDSATRSTER